MASGIRIGEEHSWLTRNWIFEQLLTDVSEHYPNENEANDVLNAVGIIGYMVIDNYGHELGSRLARMVYTAAKGILEGTLPSGALTALGAKKDLLPEYHLGLTDLVAHIEADGRYARVLDHGE
ncbi:MAG: hypothetical protein JNM66_20050 [Bryobacterales bacterium]|nr:hypothetical protein [Bryobacterales bacterium]